MKDRFYYRNGFIAERFGKKERLIADFKGGAIHINPQREREKRIIKLLNLGYENHPTQ